MQNHKYQPHRWVFKREGDRLIRGKDVLKLSSRPRTIQPNHKASFQLERIEPVKRWVSSIWRRGNKLHFYWGKVAYFITLNPLRAIIKKAPSSIPLVYHRDFVALNATTHFHTLGFQSISKTPKRA